MNGKDVVYAEGAYMNMKSLQSVVETQLDLDLDLHKGAIIISWGDKLLITTTYTSSGYLLDENMKYLNKDDGLILEEAVREFTRSYHWTREIYEFLEDENRWVEEYRRLDAIKQKEKEEQKQKEKEEQNKRIYEERTKRIDVLRNGLNIEISNIISDFIHNDGLTQESDMDHDEVTEALDWLLEQYEDGGF